MRHISRKKSSNGKPIQPNKPRQGRAFSPPLRLNVAQRANSFVKITLQLLRFAVQLGSAFVVGVLYYLVAMAPAVLDGAESFIGQPVVGIVFSAVAVGILWILGLPFRFVPSLHSWWLRRWWIPFILGMVAVAFSVVSWLPRFQVMMHHPELQTEVPCFKPVDGIRGLAAGRLFGFALLFAASAGQDRRRHDESLRSSPGQTSTHPGTDVAPQPP